MDKLNLYHRYLHNVNRYWELYHLKQEYLRQKQDYIHCKMLEDEDFMQDVNDIKTICRMRTKYGLQWCFENPDEAETIKSCWNEQKKILQQLHTQVSH